MKIRKYQQVFINEREQHIVFANHSTQKYEKGRDVLENAIMLIAFVVVASIFAFTVLSAGSASTEKGKQASLVGVHSSMTVKGSIIAEGAGRKVTNAVFTLSLVAGGSPINLSDQEVVIDYKDAKQFMNDVPWEIKWIVTKQTSIATADDLLEEGELAEITVKLAALTTALGANTAFNLEIKPPKSAVLTINRTTPAAIQAVMDLN